MNFAERVRQAWQTFRTGERAFAIGSGVVEPSDRVWGHDESQFSPAEYGDYIASSNAVYACATLRAETLSGIPLKSYRLRGGKKKEVTDGPVTALMHKVNDFWTMNRLLTVTELSLCLWGKCYWFVEKQGETPRELWWGRPDRVRVVPHPKNYIDKFVYEPVNGSDPIEFMPNEVVWFRYPNPLDEFSGLSPLAAARLAADLSSAAAKSNLYLFKQGYHPGGFITPPKGTTLTPEAARELEMSVDRRFKGVDKFHRWGVLRFEAQMQTANVTPKDAEYLGSLTWSLEEVARAYKVPLDMIGGQRTYENVQAAERAFWYRTMEPESRFIASEIVEQLVPMFGSGAGVDLVEFDLTRVPILQEAESERWSRAHEQIQVGALLINEWRESEGREPTPWGDAWWAPMNVAPIRDGKEEINKDKQDVKDGGQGSTAGSAKNAEKDKTNKDGQDVKDGGTGGQGDQGNTTPTLTLPLKGEGNRRVIERGGEEHERLWRRFELRERRWEKALGKLARELLESQKTAVLDRLREKGKEKVKKDGQDIQDGGRGGNGREIALPPESGGFAMTETRALDEVAEEPFDLAEWIRKWREKFRPRLKELVEDMGQEALADLGLKLTFDVNAPEVKRFIERRAQRFAQRVNETTWEMLRGSLGEGLDAGEGLQALMERVNEVMGERIRSSDEAIARTEAVGAANGGTMEAWKQSGVVSGKVWLAELDDRVRDSHAEAHGQEVGLDEDFQVGNGSGPHPGAIGLAEEDINCRCTMAAVIGQFTQVKPGLNPEKVHLGPIQVREDIHSHNQ